MKKIIVVFVLITVSHVSFSQNKVYYLLGSKTIVSEVYREQSILNTESTTVVDEKTKTTTITNYAKGNGKNRFIVTRNVEFKNTENLPTIKFKIQRIQQYNSRCNIDTNIPFGSDELSKMSLDNYLPYVKKNINIKLYEANNFTEVESEIIELSHAELPPLSSQSVFSGILMTEKNVNNKDWIDSIKVAEGYYINHYSLIDEGKKLFKLEGYFVPNKKTPKSSTNEVDLSTLQAGQSIEAETEILEMKYNGMITLSEKHQNVIQNIELENYSSINLTIMGSPLPQQLKTKIRVMNKISE